MTILEQYKTLVVACTWAKKRAMLYYTLRHLSLDHMQSYNYYCDKWKQAEDKAFIFAAENNIGDIDK